VVCSFNVATWKGPVNYVAYLALKLQGDISEIGIDQGKDLELQISYLGKGRSEGKFIFAMNVTCQFPARSGMQTKSGHI